MAAMLNRLLHLRPEGNFFRKMSFLRYTFPAGEESDDSTDELDFENWSDRKCSGVKVVDAAAADAEDDVSALKQAVINGDIEAVEQLLDKGVDVDTRLGSDWTPLMFAVSGANYDLAKLLLDRGASATYSKDNWTVLMTCCSAYGSEDKIARCVELLLSRNADPNIRDSSQMTCVFLAAREGFSKVINLLVLHGADVNVQDEHGYTALCVAAQYGRADAVLKLLQLGADKTIRTKSGRSPADLAAVSKHSQIVRILTSSFSVSAPQIKTTCEAASSKESVIKLDDLKLLLHGLDLGCLSDIMAEHDITWGFLLTMEEDDLEKVGVSNPVHQQKLLNAVRQMKPDRVDLETIGRLGVSDKSNEEMFNFLISLQSHCRFLTETVQDVINSFPRHPSQLVFSLDPEKKSQMICNQLVVQIKDLQTEVRNLHNLLCVMNPADPCQLPPPGSRGDRRLRFLLGVALSVIGAAVTVFLKKK